MSPEDLVMHSSHDLTMDTTEDSQTRLPVEASSDAATLLLARGRLRTCLLAKVASDIVTWLRTRGHLRNCLRAGMGSCHVTLPSWSL
jgi:hypothetical protein